MELVIILNLHAWILFCMPMICYYWLLLYRLFNRCCIHTKMSWTALMWSSIIVNQTVRIDPSLQCNVTNANWATHNGTSIEWANGCRYLGIFVTSGATLKFKFDATKEKIVLVIKCYHGQCRQFRVSWGSVFIDALWMCFSPFINLWYRSLSCQHEGDQIARISNNLCLL